MFSSSTRPQKSRAHGTLTLRLFGTFEALRNGAPLTDLRLRLGESLLAFLALHPDTALRATTLAQTFLVRRALHQMQAIEAQAERDDGIFGDHLERMLLALKQDPGLMEAVRSLLRGQGCPSTESFYRLRSAGVVIGDSPVDVRPRCRLYTRYLTRSLL